MTHLVFCLCASAGLPIEADAEELTAPRLRHLPGIELPQGVAVPSLPIEAVVLVDVDGGATLETSTVEGPLLDRVRAALEFAEFEPAMRAGVPVEARVRIRFQVAAVTPPDERPSDVAPKSPELHLGRAAIPAHPQPTPGPSYGATARVQTPQLNARRLELAETRDVPGTFGDPFRILDALPGTVPVLTGVPYVYVRGAPPASTIYFYDGIQLPALFHLALGPAVIHPAMIGDIQFYSGVAPTRYGRYTGGVLSGDGPGRPKKKGTHGELEARLLDVNGFVEADVGRGHVSISGRYGYPGLLLSLISPDAVLAYWDYQGRFELPLGPKDRFQVVALGSYDLAGAKKNGRVSDADTTSLQFHRIEARLIRQFRSSEFGVALQFGFDQTRATDEIKIEAKRLGPRLWFRWKGRRGLEMRLGADMVGSFGRIYHPTTSGSDPQDSINPLFAAAAARNTMGIYAEARLPLGRRIAILPGLRSDLWLVGPSAQPAVDPRATLEYRPSETLDFHVSLGLAHQAATFIIPVPGLSDVALDRGLQSSVQSEVGAGIDLPEHVRLEVQGFLHSYQNLLFFELLNLDANSVRCDTTTRACALGPDSEIFPRASVLAYGGELFLRRSVDERISGWISYTLGWARGRSNLGNDFTPTFDVRHVANLVLQYDLGAGFHAGIRLFARSGRLLTKTLPGYAYAARTPWFVRADAQLSYAWKTSWGRMRLALEWLNFTVSREYVSVSCDYESNSERLLTNVRCTPEKAPPITAPNLGLRGEF